jgi:hypothetical protein
VFAFWRLRFLSETIGLKSVRMKKINDRERCLYSYIAPPWIVSFRQMGGTETWDCIWHYRKSFHWKTYLWDCKQMTPSLTRLCGIDRVKVLVCECIFVSFRAASFGHVMYAVKAWWWSGQSLSYQFTPELFSPEPSHDVLYTTFLNFWRVDIPPDLLAKWILLVSAASVFNSLQNFMSTKLTQRIYSAKPQEGTSS